MRLKTSRAPCPDCSPLLLYRCYIYIQYTWYTQAASPGGILTPRLLHSKRLWIGKTHWLRADLFSTHKHSSSNSGERERERGWMMMRVKKKKRE